MPKTGRNEPCPCGSGRKYKKCCLRKERRAPAYSREARESALARLEAFVERPELEEEDLTAERAFWGDLLERADSLTDPDLIAMADDAYDGWFCFDWRVWDHRRVVDHLLEAEPDLPPGERAYLRQAAESCMSLYEVVDVHPGASVRVRDLLRAGEVTVTERLGSRMLHRWDVLAARIVPRGISGGPEFDLGLHQEIGAA